MAWYSSKRCTTVIKDHEGYMACIYHQTSVCRWNEDQVVLNSGGYLSATTKTRMNQCAQEYGLGFSVFQKNGEWFVRIRADGSGGVTVGFTDGMKFSYSR